MMFLFLLIHCSAPQQLCNFDNLSGSCLALASMLSSFQCLNYFINCFSTHNFIDVHPVHRIVLGMFLQKHLLLKLSKRGLHTGKNIMASPIKAEKTIVRYYSAQFCLSLQLNTNSFF